MTPIKAIRAKCLDCCCGSSKAVMFCTEDGVNSSECSLWPYRFGLRPATAARKYGKEFLKPGALPPHDVPLENCKVPHTSHSASGAEKGVLG